MKELVVKRVAVYQFRIIIKEEKMKTKHFFNAVMVIFIVAIFLVMAVGCTSTAGSTDLVEDPVAVQLAADINAIKAGSAVVKGDTVRLTADVDFATDLMVPAGVTLDLTANGLMLGRDAVLTVNGTVNANSGNIQMLDTGSQSAINGSGTIYLKSKGRLLQITDKRLILDGVTLVGLADNNDSLVEVYGNGGEFVMKSGAITGNIAIGDGWIEGGGVRVIEGGIFTLEDGAITGNNVPMKGGGVLIFEGTFTMTGGKISNNTAGTNGGGVWVDSGTFTMEGGTISGNTAAGGGDGDGGGVAVNDEGDSTFIMKGGRIQGGTDSDGFTKNTAPNNGSAALVVWGTAKWGTGGAYTKGGVSQTGGSDIGSTNDTLIAEM
jgi:hypothetical protein